MTLKLNNFVIASLALAKLQFITYIFYIITIFIHINDIFTSIKSYLRKLNNMTLKQSERMGIERLSFGIILNNMTLKRKPKTLTRNLRFGTILNNMTLKP